MSYQDLLIVGVKEADCHNHVYTSDLYSSEEQNTIRERLLTFKSLVPIVGYDYAKHFVLDQKYSFQEYPHFIKSASYLNEKNFIDFRVCMLLSRNGGNPDRMMSMRKRKQL